jgi:hypothetical protein
VELKLDTLEEEEDRRRYLRRRPIVVIFGGLDLEAARDENFWED